MNHEMELTERLAVQARYWEQKGDEAKAAGYWAHYDKVGTEERATEIIIAAE